VTDGLPHGGFEVGDGTDAYRISGYDRMPPFLMSIVSESDHWMYVSSRGGLTAGRIDEETCLFPYETDERLHAAYGVTGPLTILRAHLADGRTVIWRPFDPRRSGDPVERNVSKSDLGNWVEFEETDHELGLAFGYRWSTGDRFGFVRAVTLRREDESPVRRAEVLDGLLNVMPPGVPLISQQSSSTLVDAYKRSELDPETGFGFFTLESRISDRAEAAESLRANVVWTRGLGDHRVLLDVAQIDRFVTDGTAEGERLSLGRRGAYIVTFGVDLEDGEETRWDLIADAGLSHVRAQELRALALEGSHLVELIETDIAAGTESLTTHVASADGLQRTADLMVTNHHAVNVLFNIMRGGVFDHNHSVPVDDFLRFVADRNRLVHEAHRDFLATLGPMIDIGELVTAVADRDDPDLVRLTYEYLPLFFSRRHGDPSRPWNRFSILVKHPDGSRRFAYEGNWRDIFQNWEALSLSFPGFLQSIIAKFVNASTVDGHNPYRITERGIDWEVPEPANPWSHIGYWGDHQIVYLLRLAETSERYHPGAIERLLDQAVFSYADVPYRIAPYDEIVRDPKNTISFDTSLASDIEGRVETLGSDGKLLGDGSGAVQHVTLAEKLVVPALAKLASLVVDGGIWLNTQRPEWNDANNALAGDGLSMVTLCYLRRYLSWLNGVFERDGRTFSFATEVVDWFRATSETLREFRPKLAGPIDNDERRRLLDGLGSGFSDYRVRVYRDGLSHATPLAATDIVELCALAVDYLDHSIRANRRPDGLYHSYNLLVLDGQSARVEHLYEMLEGQVAVLSAGLLSSEEALELIEALFASAMYRPDQNSFMLYPARTLPPFLEKNLIPASVVAANPLLRALVEAGDESIVAVDAFGDHRFHSDCETAASLDAVLDRLAKEVEWSDLVATHRSEVLEAFDAVFRHRAFTGRSGSMYKYEGLGSIYWHMVTKLLVAIQEAFLAAVDEGAPTTTVDRLADAYHRVRSGLGFNKTPDGYGAFPADPYSHTPAFAGAQQPGMTGQVKEEIITRLGELGVRVVDGTVRFEPLLLHSAEFLTEATVWRYRDLTGREHQLTLDAGSLGFTFCQVPVVYRVASNDPKITVFDEEGRTLYITGNQLDADTSSLLFARRGGLSRIEVDIPAPVLR
jgi:hypothetical protein